MTRSSGPWNLVFHGSGRQLGVLPMLYGWYASENHHFLDDLIERAQVQAPVDITATLQRPSNTVDFSQVVVRPFIFLTSTLTTALAAASVYLAAFGPLLSHQQRSETLICCWGSCPGIIGDLWPM